MADQPLLERSETRLNSNVYLKIRLRLAPVVFCYYSALGMFGYAISVYYHHAIRDQIYGKRSQQIDLCNRTEAGVDFQKQVLVQQETSKWTIYFSIATFIPALFGNIIWGAYSDVVGRRRQFMISITGTLLRIVLCLAVVKFNLSFSFILVSCVVDGAMGTFSGVLSATCAYVSDVSPRGKTRTWRIVLIEITIAISMSIVIFSTGAFMEATGFFYPLMTSCILLIFDLAYVIFILPETLRHNNDVNMLHRSGCNFQVFRSALRLLVENRSTYCQPQFLLLSLAFIFYTMPILSRGTLEIVYQMGPPFCWSPRQLGWFGGAKAAVTAVSNVAGTYVFHKYLPDETIALISGLTGVLAFIVEGLATTSMVLYTVPVLQALSFLPVPMFRSLMCHLSSDDRQGLLFGSIGLLDTLCGLFGALITNLFYVHTISTMNGLVFILLAGMTAVGLVFLILFIVLRKYERSSTSVIPEELTYTSLTGGIDT